jgi:hypothetical protein
MIQHLIFIFTNGGVINKNGLDFDNSSSHIVPGEIIARNELNKTNSGRSVAIYIGQGSIRKVHINTQGKVDMIISDTTYYLGSNGFCAAKYLFRSFERVLGRKSALGPESLMNVLFTEVLDVLHTLEP